MVSLKACTCKVGARIKRKGGGAFSEAHKVVRQTLGDKLCGLHVLMGDNMLEYSQALGETNFVDFTCSWETNFISLWERQTLWTSRAHGRQTLFPCGREQVPNTRREDWCGPRHCSSPEAAAWWSDRRAAYLTQQTKRKHFFHFFEFSESKIQRENDGGAARRRGDDVGRSRTSDSDDR